MSVNIKKSFPPKSAERLLGWFCKGELLEEILGDLYEYYQELLEVPAWKRNVIYWFHVFHFLRPSLVKKISGTQNLNYLGMLLLTIKMARRTFLKNRVVSLMSLFGLAFGSLCFHLVYVWVDNELTMDDFHQKLDQMYVTTVQVNSESEPFPLGFSALFDFDYKSYSELENSLTIHTYRKDEIKVNTGKTEFTGMGLVVDSTFFNFFDFEVESGDTKPSVLNNPTNVVITAEFAQRLFGTEQPLGRSIDINCDNSGTYQVAAILKSIPSNSSLNFDFLIPRHSQRRWSRMPQELLLTNSSFDPAIFNSAIFDKGREDRRFSHSILSVVPLSDVYMSQPFNFHPLTEYGDPSGLRNMILIAVIIVLITTLGFSSLQSTLQLSDAKKMSLKKIVGASKGDLVMDMIVGRLGYLIISTVIGVLAFELIFPYYSIVLDIKVDRDLLLSVTSILTINLVIVSISIVYGLIQVFSIKLASIITETNSLLKVPRIQRALITVQYAVTIVLIISTAVVYTQFNYMLNKDTGVTQENILSIDFFEILSARASDLESANTLKQHAYIIERLRQHKDVLFFSQGERPISSTIGTTPWKVKEAAGDFMNVKSMNVDAQYKALFDLKLVGGRFFSDTLDLMGQQKVVINETAMKELGIKDISNVNLVRDWANGENTPFEIVGVVKDYHFEHLSNKIKPLVLRFSTHPEAHFTMKFDEGKESTILTFLEELFKEINPNGIFNYQLMQDRVVAQYAKEKRVGRVNLAFTIVALLLSSIGLFNFAFYETNRRTKEMGVRKVNGASSSNVFSLLSFSFLRSIFVAFLFACPLAWYLMNLWLENFAYQSEVSVWLYGGSGLVAAAMALLTVSWQVMQVASKNPVESLR